MKQNKTIIVVGAGHAGVEAAKIASKTGCKVSLVTMDKKSVGRMSCNPAIGGVAKGQIVREIDVLGGLMAKTTDISGLQFKILNKSKGRSVWSPRAQVDKRVYEQTISKAVLSDKNITIVEGEATSLIVKNNSVCGVILRNEEKVFSSSVVITCGTFLSGVIHIGDRKILAGRMGESASIGMTEYLRSLGFRTMRLKTGTPPRVDGRSLDYSKMEEQPGDEHTETFSYLDTQPLIKQRSCYLTHTNSKVHDVLRGAFDRSPMFNGRIQSTGPRYCPSIEDKIDRFATKDRHQVFVEPEGWTTVEIYVNGFSTSMPEDIQDKAIRFIPGFENVKFFRYGYAIEYDYFPPTQLKHSLETKLVDNLFFAGQINGTTGYEEAAAQGLMAGVNAAHKVQGKDPFILKRNEAYIGVLIDDLITKGTEEPYRMFTSRAEYRTLLRQDNADIRLTPLGFKIGLASKDRLEKVNLKIQKTEKLIKFLKQTSVTQHQINPILTRKQLSLINQSVKLYKIASRPQLSLIDFQELEALQTFFQEEGIDKTILEQVEIHLKYSGYIDKERSNADKLNKLENVIIPQSFNYSKVNSLSHEAKEKLSKIQPTTISQASRISGVSPSDISVLLVYMGR